ncbi:MAG: hypothetical protein ACYTBX_00170 [Planctomycetota bacterium]|jgi:hypothetical protein
MFYAVLQVIAAVLTIRVLSLRKLFYLSCIFSVIGALLTGLNHQMMKVLGGLSFPLFLTGQLLPYVTPVLILALIYRKKTAPEPVPEVERETISTHIEHEVTTENKPIGKIKTLYKRYWYVFDILLIIVVLLYGTLSDPFGLIAYVCGLYNQLEISAFMLFIWVFWLVPAAFCLVVLLLRIIISWPKYIRNKFALLTLRLFVFIGLGIYLILPFTPVRPHRFKIYIKGFTKNVEANADIEAIRAWLGTLKPEDCVDYNSIVGSYGSVRRSPKQLKKQEWPKVIANLHPRYVILSLDDDEYPKVRLNWGSGFLGSWGLVVGNEEMSTPESDLSRHGEYRQEICRGAYIWYGID